MERNGQRNTRDTYSSVLVNIKKNEHTESGIKDEPHHPGSRKRMKFMTTIKVKLISYYKAPHLPVCLIP